MKDSEKVLRGTRLFFRRPMKDIFNGLRETPLIFRFSIKDSEKAYIWKIKRGLPRGASILSLNPILLSYPLEGRGHDARPAFFISGMLLLIPSTLSARLKSGQFSLSDFRACKEPGYLPRFSSPLRIKNNLVISPSALTSPKLFTLCSMKSVRYFLSLKFTPFTGLQTLTEASVKTRTA